MSRKKIKHPYNYHGVYLPDGTHVLSSGRLSKETLEAVSKMVQLAKQRINEKKK